MKTNQVRIIAGKWKSRKIDFPDHETLRPTPDRVRETLFNWLATFLPGASCLDLFSGSGILAFECLSRGAKQVVCLETDPLIFSYIEKNAKTLNATGLKAIQTDAITWLEKDPQAYDIIFCDPPYQSDLLSTCFSLLPPWLHTGSLIYFESNQPAHTLPTQCELFREQKAGQIYFYLVKCIA